MSNDEDDTAALRKEAEFLAGSVRQQFLVIIAVGLSMLLVLNVSNVKLILGNDEIVLPVIDVPVTISALILIGPFMLVGVFIYMQLLLERLYELERQGIRAPQIYFFTIRNRFARVIATICLYLTVPTLLWWFFLRTTFRPEAGVLLGLACLALLGTGYALMHRTPSLHASWPGRAAAGFFGLAAVCVIGSAVGFLMAGTAPFQYVTARITDFGLEGADLSVASADVSFQNFNFDGQCLRGAKLTGLDFSSASFVGADLSGADLSGANLREADLSIADLSGADLSDADLGGAMLVEARLLRVAATGATFDGALLEDARLERADLSRASLLRIEARGARFRQADLGGARLTGAVLDCVDMREVTARSALFQRVTSAAGADFTDATMSGANFVGSNLDRSNFTRAVLSAANVGGASLKGVILEGALVSGLNLDDAAALTRGDPASPPETACQPLEMPLPPSPCS